MYEMFEVAELRQQVFGVLLPDVTLQDLVRLLRPDDRSWIWLVGYRPTVALRWGELHLPLAEGLSAEPLLARQPSFDLLMTYGELMSRLPRMHAWAGITVLQMDRRVPDTLDLARLPASTRDSVLRKNGWMLTLHLPHDLETARVECPDRAWLEQVAGHYRRSDPLN